MVKYGIKKEFDTAKLTLQGFTDNEDYKKTLELIANDEDFDTTVQIVPKKDASSATLFVVSQKSKKENRVFKSEYTIGTFWLDDLPRFYIDANSFFSVLDFACKRKFELEGGIGYSSYDLTDAVFKIFLCEVLKEKFEGRPILLERVKKMEDSAKKYAEDVIARKEKSLNATKQLLNIDFKKQTITTEQDKTQGK